MLAIIHGESIDFGAGSLLDGAPFAASSRQLVVTFNYRLNLLGEYAFAAQRRANLTPEAKCPVAARFVFILSWCALSSRMYNSNLASLYLSRQDFLPN